MSGGEDIELQTMDATKPGDATFERDGDSYSITSTGILAHNSDEYGAIYAADRLKSGEAVEVTVERQENTREWAKTGLLVANDITAAGDSAGDIAVLVTPGHGYYMRWDSNGDGFMDANTGSGTQTTYPVTLKLERLGPEITGYYSTDGGESFHKIGSAVVPDADEAMDVGMVQTSGNRQHGTAEFTGFTIKSMLSSDVEPVTDREPLPDGAEVLDRIVFGNRPSEQKHHFAPETSRLARGLHDTVMREITRLAPQTDASYEWTIGSMSFTMEVDPGERNYLTLKLQQDNGNLGRDPLVILYDDEQIGYLNGREGWTTPGGFYSGNATTGDWVYVTSVLPRSVTAGKETVELRLATYDPHASPMSGYTGTEWPVYRAYTHTDALFALPADEESTFNRDIGTPWGEDESGDLETALATLKTNVEKTVQKAQRQERLKPRAVDHLARASNRDWIESLDMDAVFETVKNSIDHHVVRQARSDGGPSETFGRGWSPHGHLARAFEILAPEFKERGALKESIPGHPEDISRRETYADFWVAGYKWRDNDRRGITNQVMITTHALINMADALNVLAPDRAPSDAKVEAWINQMIGVAPLAKLPGEGQGYEAETWHILSEAGLNREPRYASGHGLSPSLRLATLAEDTGLDRVRERLEDHIEAMGWFRWRGKFDGSHRRTVIQNGWLAARGAGWPGRAAAWLGYGRAAHAFAVLGEDSEVARRWAELMVEDGARFDLYGTHPARLYLILSMVDGFRALRGMEPSSYKLPWGRERAVFGDPDQGMVSITDGEHRFQACLGQNNGTHISDIARFDYQGPDSHRAGTTKLRRMEFPLDRMVERPNSLAAFNSSSRSCCTGSRGYFGTPYYMPWHEEKRKLNQYLRGRQVPLAGRPNGEAWPGAENWPEEGGIPHRFVGFCYYYREARIGPYLIGINSTGAPERGFGPAKTYRMDVPVETAINLETGNRVTADSVAVGPRKTVVLKLED
ncbi:MAG: hypothetical protein V5A84_01685 [Planctomycetota bacterium]